MQRLSVITYSCVQTVPTFEATSPVKRICVELAIPAMTSELNFFERKVITSEFKNHHASASMDYSSQMLLNEKIFGLL